MCMYVTKDNQFKLGRLNKEGYHTGWKLISKDNCSSFYSLYEYFIGVNISDRYFPSTLKELGIKDTEHANLYTEEYRPYSLGSSYTNYFAVHHGFHICPTRSELRKLRNKNKNYRTITIEKNKIIKVYYKPEDVIATGFWSDDHNIKTVVVNKLIVKSLDNVR